MEDLPDEIISSIVEYLDPVTKLKISLVNRRFYDIATDSLIHRSATFEPWDYLPEKLIITYLKQYGTSLKCLDLQDCYWLKPSFMSVLQQSCSQLTSLNLMGCVEIPVNVIVTIFKHNSNLRHFGWTIGLDLLLKLKNINMSAGRQAIEQVNGLGVLFENLMSLKMGLMVYSATAYKDGFEPEAVLFTHVLSRVISPKLKTLTVVCIDRGSLMHNAKLSRVLLEVHIQLEQVDNNCGSVMDLKNHFAKTRHDLAIAAITQHDGLIKGWLKYAIDHKNYTIKSLEVPGPPFLNFWIPLLGNGLTYCKMADIKSLDISSSHDVPIYWMISVVRANSLTFVNVSNMECVTSYLLEILSESSPCLESLNVQGCHDCLDPIGGLKSIATRCHYLRHLNLGRIHHHSSGSSSELFEILSSIKYLQTISLSGCSTIPYKLKHNQEISSKTLDSEVEKNLPQDGIGQEKSDTYSKVNADGTNTKDDMNTSDDDSNFTDDGDDDSYTDDDKDVNTDYDIDGNTDDGDDDSYTDDDKDGNTDDDDNDSVNSDDDDQNDNSTGNHNDNDDSTKCTIEKHYCLHTFMESCTFLRQVEIINVGFHSVLRKGWTTSRPPPERAHLIWDCPDNDGQYLKALAFCSSLEKLTLAGLDVRGGLEFLYEITSCCKKLYFLSVAQLRGLELTNGLPTLNKALSCCTSLRQLRFEQSYFAVPQSFTTALLNVTSLESLCIITKGGSIAVSMILPLFEKCQKLRVLQICADVSSSEETFRNLTNILYNRYTSERPGLAVCLFPYDSNTRDLHDRLFNYAHEYSFPLVHLKNLSLFSSEVATRTY